MQILLLRQLKLTKSKDRKCYFIDVIAYLDSRLSSPVVFTSKVYGTLSEKICESRNDYKWSKLYRIFIPDGFSKALSQISEQEYQAFRNSPDNLSHYEKLVCWLKENR